MAAETFTFTISWGGPPLTGAEIEALYEAGLADCAVETGPLRTVIDCDRQAADYQAALDSVLADIARVPGLPRPGWEAHRA